MVNLSGFDESSQLYVANMLSSRIKPERAHFVHYIGDHVFGNQPTEAFSTWVCSIHPLQRHRQPVKDAPVRTAIDDVVAKHPAWGKRLVYCWTREQGHDFSECIVYRVYHQSGHAAQWRKRSRKIRRGVRIDPIALQQHDVWCMDFAEDRLSTGRKLMALLVKHEATSFGLKITVQRSL